MIETNSRRRWSSHEETLLISLIERGYGYEGIARWLRRSRLAVMLKARRLGQGVLTSESTLSVQEVARTLGLRDPKVVSHWIAVARLPARNAGTDGHPLWRVLWDDLLGWMLRRDTWMRWDPERIPDWALREWAREERSGPDQWLTAQQVAGRLHISPQSVLRWAREGTLPATRTHQWWVWSGDLVGFVIPSERTQARPRVPDRLPSRILARLTAPQRCVVLAQDLRTSPKVVWETLKRLQRRGLVRQGVVRATWVRVEDCDMAS